MSNARPLLRELIHIPERVATNDFVLKLSDGVTPARADATIADYVVTPQLARAFDEALGIIGGALEKQRSEACYLHGSFGSGKSHFMAVLNLLLAGNLRARAVPDLAEAVVKHRGVIDNKRFLMVPFHMIGARDVESAILGGYAEHVCRVHPDAPVPGFYLGERLFADAAAMRARSGDERFFDDLNGGRNAGGDGWGDIGDLWDAATYDAAVREAPEQPERQRLVGDLIGTFFSSYADVAATSSEAFVSLDAGLAIMSAHAERLGYDAVVLFLDELILWLASNAGNVDFVSREGSKLSKLVEAQRSDRPVPIISFVARQRDLRELVGEHQAGALQLQFADTLKYWEARFGRVTLEDRNLPVIAERRLLRPLNEAARQAIDTEFEALGRNRAVMETLLGTDGERDQFRRTYPFSPALVEALIAASSVLQRERTALKLMLQMLVRRRDDLRLGGLIPVGDLWDEIATGDQPFSDGMKIQFDNARKLWTQKLLPLLEQEHNVTWQDLQAGQAEPRAAQLFANDGRLLKTLLLAALVPEVPALRALTARRLATLNHGSVVTPVPGTEGGIVLGKLNRWASLVGEIRVGDGLDPAVSLQVTGVDIEPILANASHFDNDGTRRTRLQRLLFEGLGFPPDTTLLGGQGFVPHDHAWRGTKRPIDLYVEVVRELSADRLRGRADAPVLVLGMPFDPRGRPPPDQLAHAQAFGEDSAAGGVVWQPSYLSDRSMRDLGTLVRIDELLKGDRLADAARGLSLSDREQARGVLSSRQSALHQRLKICLDAAYGIRSDTDGCLGATLPADGHLFSLDTSVPKMPVGANMQQAMGALLDQLFDYRFPAHPHFEQPVQVAGERKVLEQVQEAAGVADQRLFVDAAARRVLSLIAVPLKLATVTQTHLVLDPHWANHFSRMKAQADLARPGGPMTVQQIRQWIDLPRPMGLTVELKNLVVLAFAAQADRSLVRDGAPAAGTVDRIDDAVELQEQALPDQPTWILAGQRAGLLFGLVASELRKGATMARLARELRTKAEESRPRLTRLSAVLSSRMTRFGVDQSARRMVTLRSAQTLIAALSAAADDIAVVTELATASMQTSETSIGTCLESAEALATSLDRATWDIIENAAFLTDDRRLAAEGLHTLLAEALREDEHVVPLGAALSEVQRRAASLLAQHRPEPAPSPRPDPPPYKLPPAPPPPPGEVVFAEGDQPSLDATTATALLEELRSKLSSVPGARMAIRWRLTRPGDPASS